MTDLLLTADRLFDGDSTTLTRPVLRLRGERIEEVSTSLLPPGSCSGERHDFPGCTILPGLIDTHVHLVFTAQDDNAAVIAQVTGETDEQLLERATRNAQAALRVGITTVRDCGGRGTVVQRLRDRIRSGEVVGPDVISCGVPITTTTGHCHWLGLIANTPTEVQAAAELMLRQEADWLKVMATGGNMTPSSDPMQAQYDDASLKLIADIGRRAGKYSAAHVLSRSALPGVVAANYRTIEHCDWRVEEWRYEFNADLAKKIRDQGQYVGLTMSGTTRRAFLPQVQASAAGPIKRLDMRFECERQMLDSGINFTLHSDAGVRWTPIDTFDIGLRCAVIELKLTPREVLHAVTKTAAAALDLNDRGMIAAGKRADLLIVEGNPLSDLEALGRVRAVIKGGMVVGEVGGRATASRNEAASKDEVPEVL